MPSLHPDPQKRSPFYYCAYRLADGTRKFRSTKKKRKSEAWKVCQMWSDAARDAGTDARDLEILNEMRKARGRDPLKPPTIREYLEGWLDTQKLHLSPSTHKRYGSSIRKLLTFLGKEAEHELQTLTAEKIEAFVLSEKKAGIAPKTINIDLKAFHAALKKAFRRQHVKINVVSTVDAEPNNSAVKKAFTRPQVRALLDAAPDDEWHGLILVGYFTGLRLGDAAHLRWENLDTAGERCITLSPDKRKAGDERPLLQIPIHPNLLQWFKIWRADDKTAGSPWIFPTLSQKKGTGDKGLSNTFVRLIEAADIPNPPVRARKENSARSRAVLSYGFHSLRSTYNTQLDAVGVKVEDRMKLSDHTTAEMNWKYTKPEWSRLSSLLAKLPPP